LQLSEEQILALAPDDASKKAGRDLATPAKWVTIGANGLALWGECQGSGSKPYQTQVDLAVVAFKCSCPSRKFPCKHGLGLLLLLSRQPALFKEAKMPDWVNDWISKRTEKEEKKVEKTEKPVDEAAQAKRQQAREQKVNAGVQELLVWIKDIVRNGILSMPEKGAAYWDNMARRMVDSQAAGLAAMIKKLGATAFWNEGWQSSFMDQLLHLYLVAGSYPHISSINQLLQQDILAAIGFTVNQDELKLQDGVKDTWLVLGKETREEQQLSIEQNWLYGTQTNKYALILQFYAGGQSGQLSLSPGMSFNAELVYFPSSVPYRAIVKDQAGVSGVGSNTQHFSDWKQVAGHEAELNSRLPFRNEMPVIVEQLKPLQYQQQWWLLDREGYLCKISAEFKQIWKLLAIGGGEALTMAVIGKENSYKPLGIWYQNIYKTI